MSRRDGGRRGRLSAPPPWWSPPADGAPATGGPVGGSPPVQPIGLAPTGPYPPPEATHHGPVAITPPVIGPLAPRAVALPAPPSPVPDPSPPLPEGLDTPSPQLLVPPLAAVKKRWSQPSTEETPPPIPVTVAPVRMNTGHSAAVSAPVLVPEANDAPAAAIRRPVDGTRGGTRTSVDRPLEALKPPDRSEAAQLAACFATDYLSWDEANPERRVEALGWYLPPGADCTLGWSGKGRQRVETAHAGNVISIDYWLVVDVRARVTPYRRVAGQDTAPDDDFTLVEGARWSSVPAPTAAGWETGPSMWLRLSIPIRRHDSGALVVELAPIPENAERFS